MLFTRDKAAQSNFKGAKVARRQEPAWHGVNNHNNPVAARGRIQRQELPSQLLDTKGLHMPAGAPQFFRTPEMKTLARCTAIAATIPVPPS